MDQVVYVLTVLTLVLGSEGLFVLWRLVKKAKEGNSVTDLEKIRAKLKRSGWFCGFYAVICVLVLCNHRFALYFSVNSQNPDESGRWDTYLKFYSSIQLAIAALGVVAWAVVTFGENGRGDAGIDGGNRIKSD